MDQGSLPKPGKNGRDRGVLKELAEKRGRGSPESGSLYSDYESGQQYEDKVGSFTTAKNQNSKSTKTLNTRPKR